MTTSSSPAVLVPREPDDTIRQAVTIASQLGSAADIGGIVRLAVMAISNVSAPVFEVVNYGDNEIQELRLNGQCLAFIDHEEDGWSGMEKVREVLERVAKMLGGKFESIDALDENGEVMWRPE